MWIAIVGLVVVVVARVFVGDRRIDISSLTVIFAPFNRLRFGLRRLLSFSRGGLVLPNESKDSLFDYLSAEERKMAEERAKELSTQYDLSRLEARSTRVAMRENLYVLDLLDRHAAAYVKRTENAHVVDVGSKDFVYAPALYAFAEKHLTTVPFDEAAQPLLTGVEIDGHVVYTDLHSRADHARAWAKVAHESAQYRVLDFLELTPESDVSMLTIFYPFVTRFALLRWGLPVSEYRPEKLLAHAASMLAANGVLVIVNHTHEERDLLRALMAKIDLVRFVDGAEIASSLVDYHDDVTERSVSVYVRK